jgi:ATP-dependent DNA helicase RecG
MTTSISFEGHLARLRAQGRDDEQVEVKELVVPSGETKLHSADVTSLWESVSAFANTRGGLLFLGLSEKNGFTPAPGFDAAAVTDRIQQGLNPADLPSLKVAPVPAYSLTIEQVDGSPVVVLAVSPLSVNGPCHMPKKGLTNESFKRVGDADRKLTAFEIYELQHRFDQLTTDAEPVPGTSVDDLDQDLLAEVRRHLKASGSRAVQTGDDRWLRYLNITTGSGELTLAGLLTLGAYPQQHVPRLFIDVAVHPGRTKGTTADERFLDRRLCDGNLQAMLQDSLLAIRQNLRVRRVIRGARGIDLLEIPEDALREALANAVMHRDYSPLALGSEINVDIFPDRVEITSPGGFPGAKSADPESLVDGIPAARNRLLTRLLAEVPWPDEPGGVLAESNGSGIPRMFAAMQDAGLLVPEYDVDIARVKVTLRRFGLMEPDTRDWLTATLGDGYSDSAGIAMVLAHDLGTVSVAELRTQTGRDSDELREVLTSLHDRGHLVEVSDDHFRLPEPTDDLTAAENAVIGVLSTTSALSIREIGDLTGRSTGALRPVLRSLVDVGLVTPTAPTTSRNRKYLLTQK